MFGSNFRTREGLPAWEEALAALDDRGPIASLMWADSLAESCKMIAELNGYCGKTGHTDLLNRSPFDRCKETTGSEYCGENLAYNSWSGL